MNYSTHHNFAQREFESLLYKAGNWSPDEFKGLSSYSCRMPQLLTLDNQEQLRKAFLTAGIDMGQYDLQIEEGKGFRVHLDPEIYRSVILLEINARDKERQRA